MKSPLKRAGKTVRKLSKSLSKKLSRKRKPYKWEHAGYFDSPLGSPDTSLRKLSPSKNVAEHRFFSSYKLTDVRGQDFLPAGQKSQPTHVHTVAGKTPTNRSEYNNVLTSTRSTRSPDTVQLVVDDADISHLPKGVTAVVTVMLPLGTSMDTIAVHVSTAAMFMEKHKIEFTHAEGRSIIEKRQFLVKGSKSLQQLYKILARDDGPTPINGMKVRSGSRYKKHHGAKRLNF